MKVENEMFIKKIHSNWRNSMKRDTENIVQEDTEKVISVIWSRIKYITGISSNEAM